MDIVIMVLDSMHVYNFYVQKTAGIKGTFGVENSSSVYVDN